MAPTGSIRIEYQLTPEDYAEATRRHSRMRPWFVLWCVGALICGLLLANLPPSQSAGAGTGAGLSALWDNVWAPLLPWVIIFFFIWGVFRSLRPNRQKPWLRPARRTSPWIPIGAFAVLAIAFGILLAVDIHLKRQSATDPGESPTLDVLLSVAPWMAIMVVLAILFGRSRGAVRRGWDTQSNLHRPFVAKLDSGGIHISEPLSVHEYAWDYFPGWVETEHLLILYISPLAFVLLPKRAFGAELPRVMELMRRSISDRTRAFPVVAVLPVAPLPAIPQRSAET